MVTRKTRDRTDNPWDRFEYLASEIQIFQVATNHFLEKALQKGSPPARVLGETGYLRALIDLANGDWSRYPYLATGLALSVDFGEPSAEVAEFFRETLDFDLVAGLQSELTLIAELHQTFHELHRRYGRTDLTKAEHAEGNRLWSELRSARADYLRQWVNAPPNITLLPRFLEGPEGEDGPEFEWRAWIVPASPADGIDYALMLFLKDPYEGKLCRCGFAKCRKFFWERQNPKGGQPQRRYCSQKCRDKHHAQGTADRVRRYRERKKAEASRPRRRRSS